MKNINLISHPLIEHKLSHLRDKKTSSKEFREHLDEIARLLAYDVFRDLKLKDIKVQTPIAEANGKIIDEDVNLFPILRAGQGLVPGFLNVIPTAKVGHIGLYRDEETLKPVRYLFKYPKNADSERTFNVVLDPIIATGGSIKEALNILKKTNFRNLKVVSIISVKSTIEKLAKEFPDVIFYLVVLDNELNKSGYILPGLGDAGDRIYGTK